MNLYYQTYQDGAQVSAIPEAQNPIVIIPGLFGSTINWRAVARSLSKRHTVIVIDQRNHGQSPHAQSHTYADMVEDLRQFCDDHDLKQIILCGHSMGGKVGMLFALEHPSLVFKLAVLDIAPVAYLTSHAPQLKALMQLDLSALTSRSHADRQLQTLIPHTATRLFLLQSLTGSPGEYRWRLNLPVLLADMEQIAGFPEVKQSSPVPALFLAGDLSDYLRDQHHENILQLFPETKFASIANAAHWLHADQPEQVIDIINGFIKE